MLVVALRNPTVRDIQVVDETIRARGEISARVPTADGVVFLCREENNHSMVEKLASLREVDRIVQIDSRYVLSAREAVRERTTVRIGPGTEVGSGEFVVIAGPCSVETDAQTRATARAIRSAGARALRGGAFKPRTSPFSFQGLGLAGLDILRSVRDETGLPVVSELMDGAMISAVDSAVDVIQIGMRNAQNYALLKQVGRLQSRRPVLLKCGTGMDLDEFLSAADYILSGGNPNVILCLRGSVGFSREGRSVLNVVDIPALRKRTHLPIVVDPSHSAGHWEYVPAVAAAALVAGADGLLVEVHHDPEKALSDGEQSLRPDHFHRMMHRLRLMAPVLGRTMTPCETPFLVPEGHPMAELCLEGPGDVITQKEQNQHTHISAEQFLPEGCRGEKARSKL